MKRFLTLLAVASVALAFGALSPGATHLVAAATAPPPPPAPGRGVPATPTPGQLNIPLSGVTPQPTPSAPADDNRKGLDGVWEVVIQEMNGDPQYDHMKLAQKGSVLTGTFLDNQNHNKQYPVAGSIDAKTVHLVVTKDDGTTIVFNGTVDGTTDMIGMMQVGPAKTVAFTAAYRPKYKFIDTISPVPGNLGSGIGSGP